MQTKQVLEHFAAMLRARFTAGVFTTEDSVRYTFYSAASLYGGIRHTEVVLEYPHPVIGDARIDTIILAAAEREPIAIEFKYDRGNPGGSNQNRTQRAASVLVDVFRLAKIPTDIAARRYFVYVTDSEMAGYFKNPANRLCSFFDLSASRAYSLRGDAFSGFSQTFRARVDPHVCDCQVRGIFAADLGKDVLMRTFEVLPPNTAMEPTNGAP